MSQHGLDTGGTRDQVARLRQQASCFSWAAPLRRLFAAGQLIVDEALVQECRLVACATTWREAASSARQTRA